MKFKPITHFVIALVCAVLMWFELSNYSTIVDTPYMTGLMVLLLTVGFFNAIVYISKLMPKRCKHDYYLQNQFEMKSEFDIVVESGKIPNTWTSRQRLIVTDYKCRKCSKIKRLTAKTPS